jgi:hypothetical protein
MIEVRILLLGTNGGSGLKKREEMALAFHHSLGV